MVLKSFVLVSWVGRSTSICSVNYRQISCVWCIIFYHLLDCGSWVIWCIEIVTNKIYVHCPTRSSQSENCINRHSSRCNMGVSQLKLINRPGSDNKMEELFSESDLEGCDAGATWAVPGKVRILFIKKHHMKHIWGFSLLRAQWRNSPYILLWPTVILTL